MSLPGAGSFLLLAFAVLVAAWYRLAARAAHRRYQAATVVKMRAASAVHSRTAAPWASDLQDEDADPASLTERWPI